MRKGTFGRYECIYNNGSSHDVERWLRTSRKLDGVHENLSIHGYDDFDSELQRLLERLK